MTNLQLAEIWSNLKQGLQDYCTQSGLKTVVLGLSGGLDSAISAVLAADALGAENVTAVMLKTQYTSDLSLQIAHETARLNGFKYQELDMEPLIRQEKIWLQQAWKSEPKPITSENLQARTRGLLLMAYANQYNSLLLACGNKSEALTGYCTLYGDTCGGLMPIGNLYKTTIFELAKWRNAQSLALPDEVIKRAPSAELSENQKDEDSLPPYAVLDKILAALIDEHKTQERIAAEGFAPELIQRVKCLVEKSAFKREQMAKALDIG